MANEKIIAVWGPPHSGKTTFAMKFAQSLYETSKRTVIVIFTDIITPALPVIFPNNKSSDLYSAGTVLSKIDIYSSDVVSNLVTFKERMNLGFLGYRNGENKYSFPEYSEEKAISLYTVLSEIADYIVVDCMTNPNDSVLTDVAMRNAGTMIKLCTPDLSCLSFYRSQGSVMLSGGYFSERQFQIMNIPDADLVMLSTDAGAHLGRIEVQIPFSQMLREQYLEGNLCMPTHDRKYIKAIRAVVEMVRR